MNLRHDGLTQSVEEWALDWGIPADLIIARIKAGWTNAAAIEAPMDAPPGYRLGAAEEPSRSGRKASVYLHDGKALTLKEWSEQTGFSVATLRCRMAAGRTLSEAIAMTPKRGGDRRSNHRRGWQATSGNRLGTGGGSSAQDSV